MSRTRLIRPSFFKHSELFDAEQASGLPLRLAYAGLWTVADKAGRFAWKPRDIKADVLPHDTLDFGAILDVLHQHGFIVRYTFEGKHFGAIPSWSQHQHPHSTERASTLPSPTENGSLTVSPRVNAVAVAVRDTGTNYSGGSVAFLMPLVRQHCYGPDGKPPHGYAERRDASILARLLEVHPVNDIAAAIEGLPMLRGTVDWLKAGEKITLRAIYHTRSGVRPTFGLAVDAYHKSVERRTAPSGKSQPTRIDATVELAQLKQPA